MKKNAGKKSGKWMKGQFFVLGAIMIVTLFFSGLPRGDFLKVERTEDLVYLFDNIEREFPVALNNALNTTSNINSSIADLFNFTRFVDRLMTERLTNYTTLWVVSWNISTTDINITAGNFLKYNTTVSLNVSSTVNNISVNHNTTNSTTFSSVSSEFNITIIYGSEEETFTWRRDKVNMYALIQVGRGEDLIRDSINV